jgi:hypothetical protein
MAPAKESFHGWKEKNVRCFRGSYVDGGMSRKASEHDVLTSAGGDVRIARLLSAFVLAMLRERNGLWRG